MEQQRLNTKNIVTEKDLKEEWKILTPDNEQLLETHNCYETKRQCMDAGDKHFDELVVKRPCWKEQITYVCESNPLNGCQYLSDKGCTLQKSICVDDSVKPCMRWKRHYRCLIEEELISPGLKGSSLFCLDGECHTPAIDKNTDMNQAVAYLSVFREIQKNMTNTNPPMIFRGESAKCSRHMVNFTNCCTSLKGWGVNMGLSKCSAEEKALAKRRGKGLCHYVGTYCAEKIPLTGICIRKKSTYCCFCQ